MALRLRRSRPPEPAVVHLDLPDGRRTPLAIVRSRRRTVGLKVDRDGKVTLRLGRSADLEAALRFAHERAAWVAGHLRDRTPPQPLVDGATVWLEGRPFNLRVETAAGRARLRLDEAAGELCYSGPRVGLSRALTAWFKRIARPRLESRVGVWADRMGETMPRLAFGDPAGRWGSCNARLRRVNLSWRLIMLPPTLADGVIIHELAHLAVPDHSARFWARVLAFDPDGRSSRRHLGPWHARIHWADDETAVS